MQMVVTEGLTQAQVERILHSDTFRNSDMLRLLLRFLADGTLSGDADQLKEICQWPRRGSEHCVSFNPALERFFENNTVQLARYLP